jgi:hypothetical protein
MRKLFFVGTGPLGCYPLLRQQSVTKECNAEANSLSMQYNTAVQNLLGEMSTRHPDFRYSFLDQYAALQQYINEPQANGKKMHPLTDRSMMHSLYNNPIRCLFRRLLFGDRLC